MNKLFKTLFTLFLGILFFTLTFTANSAESFKVTLEIYAKAIPHASSSNNLPPSFYLKKSTTIKTSTKDLKIFFNKTVKESMSKCKTGIRGTWAKSYTCAITVIKYLEPNNPSKNKKLVNSSGINNFDNFLKQIEKGELVAKKEEASWVSRVKKWYLGKEQSQTQQVAKKEKKKEKKVAKKEKKKEKKVAKKETYYCVANDTSLSEQYFSTTARCPTKYTSVSADEYASFKKQVKPTETKQVASDKPNIVKEIEKLFVRNKKKVKMKDVVELGTYQEFESYPEGMLKEFGNCKKQFCRGKKAGKKVYEYFGKRGPLWHKRHPGDIIHGMAWFEIFYLEKLRKNKDQIARYLENGPKGYKSKFKMQKDVNSLHGLINMNKGRKKMRDALGFSLDDDLELVLRQEWLLGEFLNHDEYKVKRVSLNKEILKRKDLLARYQTSLKKYKEKLSEERDGG